MSMAKDFNLTQEALRAASHPTSSIASRSTFQHSFSTITQDNRGPKIQQNPLSSHINPLASDAIDYTGFLCRLGLYHVSSISAEDVQRSSDKAYGSGATMTVYPGVWHRDRNANAMPEVVALKYCNNRAPQGISSIAAFVRDMNSRFKSFSQELQVMASREGRYYKSFPRIFGICWEELSSPAQLPFYRPILVVEAAISDLEEYIRRGSLIHPERHKDEKHFVSSILSAINFLHQECGLVHGDLKPSNILVFRDKQTGQADLKLADFGFAHEITGYSPNTEQPHEVPGLTPYWSAPETYPDSILHHGGRLNLYTKDYYSFGLVVWFILFGYPVGDLRRGLTQEDINGFKKIKQEGMISFTKFEKLLPDELVSYATEKMPSLQDMLKQEFDSRWKWQISDPCYVEELENLKKEEIDDDGDSSGDEDEEDIDATRGKFLSKLMGEGKIKELEWDSQSSMWVETDDPFHHTFRALMETALERHHEHRRTVLHKPSQELLTPRFIDPTSAISYQLAALYIVNHPDPKSRVFGAWEMKYGPTSLRHFEMQITRQWNRKKDQHESGRDDMVPPLQPKVIESLPQGMAESILERLVTEASEESKPSTERHSAARNILAFRHRFPGVADFDAWFKQQMNSSSVDERLDYLIVQILEGNQVDWEEADRRALEAITNFPGRDIGEPLFEMFKVIDCSLTSIPVRCAIWDYVTEFGINTPPEPDYRDELPPPIFQSILDGDISQFKEHAAAQEGQLPSLIFDECNLLHFAILHKQEEIMRYLTVERDFMIGDGEGYGKALDALILDPHAEQMLLEMDLCYVLSAKKLFTKREVENSQIGPLAKLLLPENLAIIARTGSRNFMDVIDREYRDPLRIDSSMVHITSVEDAEEELNPLHAALQTRRLPAFIKLLHWGASYGRRTFSPDSMVGGASLLVHAIKSMAPFFVGALLANGAAVNQASPHETGLEISPLYQACCTPPHFYKSSLQRRYDLHEEMGFPESVLKQDELAIESSESDCESLRKLIVELLLRNGADINLGALCPPDLVTGERENITPLLGCIKKGKEDLAIFLIEKGAGVNPPDSTAIPLSQAIVENIPAVVCCLFEHGASPDGSMPLSFGLPLQMATLYNRLDIFKLLLERGASLEIELPQYDGELVFHVILEQTSETFLRELYPEDLEGTLRTASSPSLEALIQDKRLQRQILVSHLKSMPQEDLKQLMNHSTPGGETAIFFAADYIRGVEEADLDLLLLIIANTADLKARNAVGYSALEKAIGLGNSAFSSVYVRCLMAVLGLE